MPSAVSAHASPLAHMASGAHAAHPAATIEGGGGGGVGEGVGGGVGEGEAVGEGVKEGVGETEGVGGGVGERVLGEAEAVAPRGSGGGGLAQGGGAGYQRELVVGTGVGVWRVGPTSVAQVSAKGAPGGAEAESTTRNSGTPACGRARVRVDIREPSTGPPRSAQEAPASSLVATCWGAAPRGRGAPLLSPWSDEYSVSTVSIRVPASQVEKVTDRALGGGRKTK